MTTDAERSVSGLCLMVRREHLGEVEEALGRLDWVEVHGRDEETGRLIVVQEHETVEQHQKGLRSLQAIPNVLTADLVVHRRASAVDEVS